MRNVFATMSAAQVLATVRGAVSRRRAGAV